MERAFDIQLEKLKVKLIKMCSLVDEQVDFAIKSVEENDMELAKSIIERDVKVDKYDIKIEKICYKLFALNQPVAMDLRLVISALKINANLERIGDLTSNIARYVLEMENNPPFFDKLFFSESAFILRDMIKKAIDAFITNDSNLAKDVFSLEDKLDDLVDENLREIVNIMKADSANVDNAIKFYSIFQEIERIGDHATNISEEVYFIVKAMSLKHLSEQEIIKTE
jgi:phosphate transport system protein